MAIWYTYFMTIWDILRSIRIFYGQMVYYMVKWYISWSNDIFYGQMVYFMVKWYVLGTFRIFMVNLSILWQFAMSILWSIGIF
jgi:hypothetical protein